MQLSVLSLVTVMVNNVLVLLSCFLRCSRLVSFDRVAVRRTGLLVCLYLEIVC